MYAATSGYKWLGRGSRFMCKLENWLRETNCLSAKQTNKVTEMCGARLPASFVARLDELGDDDAAVIDYGIEYTTRQCEALLRHGVPGLHFYSLNKAHSTTQVVRNLGLARP